MERRASTVSSVVEGVCEGGEIRSADGLGEGKEAESWRGAPWWGIWVKWKVGNRSLGDAPVGAPVEKLRAVAVAWGKLNSRTKHQFELVDHGDEERRKKGKRVSMALQL
jgi:hypothetical protein